MAERSKREIIEERDSIRFVTSTSQGRRFIWDLMSYCGLYHAVVGEDVERQLGRRDVALYILSLLSEHDEEKIFQMMREAKVHNQIKENNDGERSNNTDNDSTGYDFNYGADYDSGHESELPGHDYSSVFV